ncbi:MAG: RNA polymerase sigma factor [Candidatus Limnocylindria bacterium]
MGEPEGRAPSPAANDSWRTWLMTGSRRTPTDRRRVRGSHRGLKKMLVEGMRTGGEQPYSWKEFSDAMVRQSVGEAIRNLPKQDSEMVKLAYFGGLSNRQIAARLGTTESTVRRRLRQALATISAHVERGRSAGRRVVCALAVWLSGRWLGDATHHLAQAGVVLGAAAVIVAAAVPATMQVIPVPPLPVAGPGAVAISPHQSSSVSTAPARRAVQQPAAQVSLEPAGGRRISLPGVQLPVAVPPVPPAVLKLKPPV